MKRALSIEAEDKFGEIVLMKSVKYLKSQPNVKLRRRGKKISISKAENDEADNMMLPGKPMTWAELKKEVRESWEQYKRGEYYTTKEFFEDMKKW